MPRTQFNEVTPTPAQQRALDVAMVAFMSECPFFANLMHSIGKVVLTKDIPTLATNGRHVVINPEYLAKLTVPETTFAIAHEMWHLVGEHPQRMTHYAKVGSIKGKPADVKFANVCADYTINADLIENGIGQCNPSWLFRPDVKGSELWEDVYERLWQDAPQRKRPPGQDQPCEDGQQGEPNKKLKDDPKQRAFGKPDKDAEKTDGQFDQILPVPVDDDGEPDLPDANEFKEAIARAAAVAKAVGKLPASMERLVNEVLDPQVDWREHIRMLVTGKIGARAETWTRPNRRRLALNPIMILPGRKGYGCETVVVGVDTSGSIGQRELDVFFAEVGGILNDVKPRRIVVIGCDAHVSQVEEVYSLDEFDTVRSKGLKGGGGTRFEPVFEYVEEHDLRPETLIYLTDLYGSFPSKAPDYPVVWAATTAEPVPWGEVVRIKD
jgi:predicted metal-dependent peptidase